jgi:SAM-dependent methyltransferase
MSSYALSRDSGGAERLRLLGRVFAPTTEGVLLTAGLHPGLHCLDVGCGVGTVTIALARRVGPEGLTVGVDNDAHFLELARQGAAEQGVAAVFRLGDANALDGETGYDLIYSRFVLSHLPDPARALERMVRAARPGGTLVVEDIEFAASWADPPSEAYTRSVALYQAVVRRRGADPNLGPRLAGLVEAAGVEGINVEAIQPSFRDGEGKRLPRATMEGIRQSALDADLASSADVDAIVEELAALERDPRSTLSSPRIFQVWGRTRRDLPSARSVGG